MVSFVRTTSLAKRAIKNYFSKKPFCVSFEVTYNCNALCKHCHLGGGTPVNEERATPQRYGELCRQIKPLIAQVSGGEPLLRRDLEQIVKALRNSNGAPYIVVTTNGVLLTKERYIRLREAGVDEFSLSLDYPDERHDEFRGVPGLFKRIEAHMEDLKLEDDKGITLSCVVQSDNFRELIRMAELAWEWNVSISFSTYTFLRTNDKSYMLSSEELEEFKEIIKYLLDFKKKHKNIYNSDYVFKNMIEFFDNESLPNCRAGERFLVVNPDGSLSPCGLIIKEYKSPKEIKQGFMGSNDCEYCYTAIRANSEKPTKYLIKDSIEAI
jgi:MoaA/NifB/PqqE/SkfB family radical SAM enzyme